MVYYWYTMRDFGIPCETLVYQWYTTSLWYTNGILIIVGYEFFVDIVKT